MKRVMRSSVIGTDGLSAIDKRNGMMDPRDPMTFPYRTTAKRVSSFPAYELPATNNLSEVSFVAPYKLIGLLALSVESATTRFTPWSIHASIKFMAPITLVFTHSNGLYSAVGTILVAAA